MDRQGHRGRQEPKENEDRADSQGPEESRGREERRVSVGSQEPQESVALPESVDPQVHPAQQEMGCLVLPVLLGRQENLVHRARQDHPDVIPIHHPAHHADYNWRR